MNMHNSLIRIRQHNVERTALRLLLILLMFLVATPIWAKDTLDDAASKSHSVQLAKFEKDLKRKTIKEASLSGIIKQVSSIKSDALKCEEYESSLQEKLKLDLASLGEPAKNEVADVKKKRAELKREIADSENLLASCRVLILRSDETLKALSEYQQVLLATRLLARGPNIKLLLQENWNKPSIWIEAVRTFITKNSGLDLLSAVSSTILLLIMGVAYAVGRVVSSKVMRRLSAKTTTNSFSNHFSCNVIVVFSHYAPHFMVSISAAVFFFVLSGSISPLPFISVVVFGLPFYFLVKAIIEVFLDPHPPAELFHGLSDQVSRSLAGRLKVLLLLIFIGYLLITTLLVISLPEEVYLLSRQVFTVIFVLNMIWVVRLLGQIPRFSETVLIRFGSSLVLVFIGVAELMGYRNLTNFMVIGLLGSLFSFGLLIFSSRLVSELFEGLENGKRTWQRRVRESLGIKTRKRLPELAWSRIIIVAGLWLVFIVALLHLWGLSQTGFQQLRNISMEGFTLGSLKVIPVRILMAIIALVILLAISSWFRTRLERNWLTRTKIERGAREATATISGYIGVALALIIALSIAGVEFGNLAIIAGALSVGIGFGLQNIVNNFVSGLILLFERPIKTGDWIVVGATEGFVRRISIRSTQIQTFDQADVIVPNSELISGQVTNWMLRDVRGRIRVPIGVAYGSDTELVKNLLLEIASNNQMVVDDNSLPEPKVLFMSFGDSALMFELRAFIKNIDQKPQVISDLNFAIDAAFRANNIEIPFPQRDIHIKSGKLE